MKTTTVVAVYLGALIAANFSVLTFGATITPITAFLLIGLDLTLRDVLQARLSPWSMLAVILGAGALTYLISNDAEGIAVASSCAFVASSLIDWAVFSALRGRSWFVRSNASNFAAAVVDSLLFPFLAFGGFFPVIFFGQLAAKFCGGMLWASFIGDYSKRHSKKSRAVDFNEYSYAFNVICPSNEAQINYSLTMYTESDNVVMVEDLMAECAKFARGYHEAIAEALYKRFGGKQIIVAYHHGVNIRTVRGSI